MRFSARTRIEKSNVVNRGIIFYLFKSPTICTICLYYRMQCIDGFSLLLQSYVRKGNDAFLCYRKNPVKCSACAVARKIEADCFCRNLPISNGPVIRISRNLAKQKFRNHVNDLSQKIWILTCSENDLQRITKIAYAKILLKQFWQKGFNVNSQWANDEKNLTTGFFFKQTKTIF